KAATTTAKKASAKAATTTAKKTESKANSKSAKSLDQNTIAEADFNRVLEESNSGSFTVSDQTNNPLLESYKKVEDLTNEERLALQFMSKSDIELGFDLHVAKKSAAKTVHAKTFQKWGYNKTCRLFAIDLASRNYHAFTIVVDPKTKTKLIPILVKFKQQEVEEVLGCLPKGTHIVTEACSGVTRIHGIARECGLYPHAFTAESVKGMLAGDKTDENDCVAIYDTFMAALTKSHNRGIVEVVVKTNSEMKYCDLAQTKERFNTNTTRANNRLKALLQERGIVVPERVCCWWHTRQYLAGLMFEHMPHIFPSSQKASEKEIDAKIDMFLELPVDQIYAHWTAGGSFNEAAFADFIAMYLGMKDYMQADALDAQCEQAIEYVAKNNQHCQALMKVSGIACISSLYIYAYMLPLVLFNLDTTSIQKYVGYVPKGSGTGGITHILGVNKRGIHPLKKVLYQVAHNIIETNERLCRGIESQGGKVKSWTHTKLLEGKNRKSLAVSVANKVVEIATIILRGNEYDRNKDTRLVNRQVNEDGSTMVITSKRPKNDKARIVKPELKPLPWVVTPIPTQNGESFIFEEYSLDTSRNSRYNLSIEHAERYFESAPPHIARYKISKRRAPKPGTPVEIENTVPVYEEIPHGSLLDDEHIHEL
uniref:hypothetical protein n=1 Tax=Anaerobiospirillum succiniciproducens TaxID=13335 RepID=UPI00248DEC21